MKQKANVAIWTLDFKCDNGFDLGHDIDIWIFKVICDLDHLVTKVRCKDLPDSDRGDFRCRRAVDSSSFYNLLLYTLSHILAHIAPAKDTMAAKLTHVDLIRSLKLILIYRYCRFHLPCLKMSCSDLTQRQDCHDFSPILTTKRLNQSVVCLSFVERYTDIFSSAEQVTFIQNTPL